MASSGSTGAPAGGPTARDDQLRDSASTLAFLDGLSPSDAARYFLLRRSSVPVDTVTTLVKPLLPPMLSDDAVHGFVVAVTGAVKALAVQLSEAARDVAGDSPISESHMVSGILFGLFNLLRPQTILWALESIGGSI